MYKWFVRKANYPDNFIQWVVLAESHVVSHERSLASVNYGISYIEI